MGVFDRLARQLQEACNGRIRHTPGNWVFERTPFRASEGYHCRMDQDGREMYLTKQKGVRCINPDKCQGVYPRGKDVYFVPLSVCRKCEHYRKGGADGLRYPHCEWERRRRGGSAGAAEEELEIYRKANESVNKAMGAMLPRERQHSEGEANDGH